MKKKTKQESNRIYILLVIMLFFGIGLGWSITYDYFHKEEFNPLLHRCENLVDKVEIENFCTDKCKKAISKEK